MGKPLVQGLIRLPTELWVTLLVLLTCSCSTIQPHLSDDEINALRSVPTAVIYVEPHKPIYAYMRGMEDSPGMPGNSSVEQGMAFGIGAGIATEIVYEKQAKAFHAFMESFSQYSEVVDALKIPEAEREVARNAMKAVPWYRNVEWKVVPASNDSDFFHKTAQITNAQAVIFISPVAMIRTDAEVVRIDYRINIYVKNPDNKFDLHRFDSKVIGYEEDIYPGNQSPSDELEDAFDGLSIDQRFNDIFSNNGALFHQTMSNILATLQTRLSFYFTGKLAKNVDVLQDK